MTRPIEIALAEDRAAKQKVRQLWLAEVEKYRTKGGTVYLTLPGAEGRDIQMLIEAGVVATTETGAIAAQDREKIVAVESNSEAVLTLQRRFPGLKIRESKLEDVINGIGIYAWPNNEIKADLCAHVINLDLNKSLHAKLGEEVSFPLIQLIKKISHLHRQPPGGVRCEAWTLCVTVNSTINWPEPAIQHFFSYLGDNCRHHVTFREALISLFGQELVTRMQDAPSEISIPELSNEQLQQLLCIFLPKLIIAEINDHRWAVEDCKTLAYGGKNGQAPMTTVTLAFRISPNSPPAHRYTLNLSKVVPGLGSINEDGELYFALG